MRKAHIKCSGTLVVDGYAEPPTKEEFEIVEKILFTVTTKAIVMRFKYDSKEEARENFLKQIEYLKNGIMRGEKHV